MATFTVFSISCEKQRAALSRRLHDRDNRMQFLTKKNQLMENELQSKIDQCQSLERYRRTQGHERLVLSNQKQRCVFAGQQKVQQLVELRKKYDQLGKLSASELRRIAQWTQENEQLKSDIIKQKQEIAYMRSRNQRQLDESCLLKEKMQLSTQLHDLVNREQVHCACQAGRFRRLISDLQNENDRLLHHLRRSRINTLTTTACRYHTLSTKDSLESIEPMQSPSLLLSRQSSSKRVNTKKVSEDYITSVDRLTDLFHQIVCWREKLAWIDRLYLVMLSSSHARIRLTLLVCSKS